MRAAPPTIQPAKVLSGLICALLAAALPPSHDPEQVHLAPGDSSDSMVVSWVTRSKCDQTIVTFKEASTEEDGPGSKFAGPSHDESSSTHCTIEKVPTNHTPGAFARTNSGNSSFFAYRKNRFYTHTAEMAGLRPRTYYSNEFGWSRAFKFRSLPAAGSEAPFRVCIFGDMGLRNGVSIPYLRQAARSREVDLLVHVGDIAYDFHYRKRGNDYMNALEEVFAQVPYVIVPGNHEEDGRDFYNLRHRFRMPNSPDSSNQFHTFTAGPVKFVGVSTELYYKLSKDTTRQKRAQRQLAWLHSTLKEGASDKRTPWLIAYQHRPFFCSSTNGARCPARGNSRLCDGVRGVVGGLEEVFNEYGVDLIFAGHEHFYERFQPLRRLVGRRRDNRTPRHSAPSPHGRRVISESRNRRANHIHNALAPVNIVTGAAGCKEPLTRFRKTRHALGSIIRERQYGFTMLSVDGRRALRLEQVSVQDKGRVIDRVTFTKSADLRRATGA